MGWSCEVPKVHYMDVARSDVAGQAQVGGGDSIKTVAIHTCARFPLQPHLARTSKKTSRLCRAFHQLLRGGT